MNDSSLSRHSSGGATVDAALGVDRAGKGAQAPALASPERLTSGTLESALQVSPA